MNLTTRFVLAALALSFISTAALEVGAMAHPPRGGGAAAGADFEHALSRAFTAAPRPPVIVYQQILSRAPAIGPPPNTPEFHWVVSRAFAVEMCQPDKPGDLNCSGSVGVADLLILLSAWGQCADCSPGKCPADLDGDCAVGVSDLLILLANWG